MPPSIGAPATMREVEYSGNAWVQAPLGLLSRMPSHTSGPENISLPVTSKQLSTALAGRFCKRVRVGLARMLAIHSSITAAAASDNNLLLPSNWLVFGTSGMVSMNQMTRLSELPVF